MLQMDKIHRPTNNPITNNPIATTSVPATATATATTTKRRPKGSINIPSKNWTSQAPIRKRPNVASRTIVNYDDLFEAPADNSTGATADQRQQRPLQGNLVTNRLDMNDKIHKQTDTQAPG